ncbi:hypothetical protein [Clostridium thermarum]|uniref:hypothetical protein n=1 Tax=Clostridium thermarum TaxID=1716543 RepID=UPI00111F785E|nr:hypothetical protein [Clostridium thermarum]
MDKLNNTLYKVLKWDLIIGSFTGVIIQLLTGKYLYIIFAGIVTAFVNFTLNNIQTNKLIKDCGRTFILYILGFLLRSILTALIAFKLFTNNIYSGLLFLLGYCLHFASLFIISVKVLFAREGK